MPGCEMVAGTTPEPQGEIGAAIWGEVRAEAEIHELVFNLSWPVTRS